MAVALVNATIGSHVANQTSITRSFTVSAGADLLIVAPVIFDAAAATFTGVTFNGDTCTVFHSTTVGTGRISHYTRVAPDIATGNIIVNVDVTADCLWCGAHSWSGADQTTPLADSIGGGTSVTVNNVTADDIALALGADNYTSTITGFTPSNTQIWESAKGTTGQICGAQSRTGTGSLALSWPTATLTLGARIVAASAVASATLGGTVITTSVNEADIVAGGKTIILELTNDTWVTAGATFDATRDDIIAGLDSNLAEAAGWDAVVKVTGLSVTDVVRTDNDTVTITLPAVASYDISLTETITVTIPAVALTGGVALGTTPTSFVISAGSGGGGGGGLVGGGLVSTGLVNGGGLVS